MGKIVELSNGKGGAERLTKARYGLLNERNKRRAHGYAEAIFTRTLADMDIEELLSRLPDALKREVANYVEELLQGQKRR